MKTRLSLPCVIFFSMVLYSSGTISRDAASYGNDIMKLRASLGRASIILVDFAKPSCSDRLFVYDDGKPVYSGVVLHGNGRGSTAREPEFSDEVGSDCSCLGLFRVVGFKKMRNGYPSLVLEGLDETNGNAKVRGIRIHPSVMASLLPFEMKGPCFPLTNASNGCFAVSYHTFRFIENLNTPIYLYAKY